MTITFRPALHKDGKCEPIIGSKVEFDMVSEHALVITQAIGMALCERVGEGGSQDDSDRDIGDIGDDSDCGSDCFCRGENNPIVTCMGHVSTETVMPFSRNVLQTIKDLGAASTCAVPEGELSLADLAEADLLEEYVQTRLEQFFHLLRYAELNNCGVCWCRS